MARSNNTEVPPIQRCDRSDLQVRSGRHDRRVDCAKGQNTMIPNQLRNAEPVIGDDASHSRVPPPRSSKNRTSASDPRRGPNQIRNLRHTEDRNQVRSGIAPTWLMASKHTAPPGLNNDGPILRKQRDDRSVQGQQPLRGRRPRRLARKRRPGRDLPFAAGSSVHCRGRPPTRSRPLP
jgi:hypothetical protein